MSSCDQAPAGLAFLALWNGIASPAWQAEYETWHSFEHVPERVGLPGFVTAQRYRALAAGTPSYFTWYELSSLDALASPAYRRVVDQPTPWSARMRGVLRDFHRVPGQALARCGASTGRYVIPLHLAATPGAEAEGGAALQAACRSAVADGALLSVRWGQGQAGHDFPLANTGAPAPSAAGEWVALLYHLERDALEAACTGMLEALAPACRPLRPAVTHEFLTSVRREELPPASDTHDGRQPPLSAWMARFASEA